MAKLTNPAASAIPQAFSESCRTIVASLAVIYADLKFTETYRNQQSAAAALLYKSPQAARHPGSDSKAKEQLQSQRYKNPLAPKLPRRGSLAADDTDRFGSLSDWYGFSCGEAMFARDRPPKVCGNLHILHIGPASAKCTVPIWHGRNIGPTWGQLWPARPQLAPTWLRLQLWPNLAPTWCNLAISWTHFGATSAKSRGPSWAQPGPILRTQCKTLKTCIFTFFYCYFHFGWGFVRAHVAHIGPVLGPTSAANAPAKGQVAHVKPNLRPNVPTLRPSWAQVGAN